MYNKIQFKIIALITLITAIFVFGLFSFRHSAMKNVSSLLKDRVEEKDTIIKRIIDLKSKSMTSYTYDYSYWDEMLEFMKTKDEQWAFANLVSTMPTFNVDAVWLYDKDFNLFYTTNNFNERTFKELPLSKEDLKSILIKNHFAHFFINTSVGLMEISSGPLQPGMDVKRLSTPQGYFIGGRVWDNEYVSDLSVISSSKISVLSNIKDTLVHNDLSSFEFINEIYLKDWNNSNLVKIRAITESPVIKNFISFTTYQFFATILFVILIITLISLFLFRIVNIPLRSITYSLESENTEPINYLQKQKNEFGQIAGLIREFFRNKEYLLNEISMRKKAEEELIKKHTELNVAKDKAEELSKLKSALLANLSHEFRTPLSGIIGLSELLKDEINNKEQLKLLNDISFSGKRLHDTLNSILLLAQFESSNIVIHKERFRIAEEIQTYFDKYKYKAEEKNLNFNIIIEDKDVIVETDKDLLKQIFYNLFDNAVKFTDKGSISVKLSSIKEKDNLFAVISISDTGIGISENNIKIIFDEFRQVSEGFTRKYEGTGLGLTLTRKVLDLLGGAISCRSESGAGSTFSVTLHALENVTIGQEEVIKNEIIDTAQETKMQVLCVEDNPSNRFVFEKFVNKFVKVDFAPDGETAMKLINKNKYDLVFMDINLGIGIDGIQVTKEIKSIEKYKNIPIVALTGYAMEHDKDYFLSNGFDYFVVKPFSKNDLLDVINQIKNKL